MGILDILLGLALAPRLLFIAAVGVVAWWWFGGMMARDKNRAQLVVWAESETWRVMYRRTLAGALNWLDRFWAPNHLAENRPATSLARAWNWRLYNFCLLLAMAYPLLSVIVVWAITGDAGRVGALEVIPAEENIVWRAVIIVLLAAQIVTVVYALRADKELRRLGAFVLAVAVGVAVGGAFTGAIIFTFPFTFTFTVVGAMAGAGAGTFAIVGIIVSAIALAVSGAIAIAFGFVVWVNQSKRRDITVFGVTLGYIILTLITLRFFTKPEIIDDDARLLITFLVLLPFVNAVFDYGSLGLTRWCLRRGLASRWRAGAFMWSIIDAVAALALFMALGAAMIGVLHITRFSDGSALIDLPGFFADLEAHPGDYWWLYITFFSTLLPTFLHMCLVLFSLLGWARRGAGKRIAGWIRGAPDDWFDAVKARATLTGLTVAAIALPSVGIGMIIAAIWGNAHIMALWFFEQFEQIAQGMGAL